jgi:hypothetical protein
MTDQTQTDEDSGQFNPYAPGEATLDPTAEPEASRPGRIADSEPPDQPTLGRFRENFPVVFGRVVGPVGGAWMVLVAGFLAFAGLAAAGLVGLSPVASEKVGGPIWSLRMAATLLAACLYGHVGVVWAGPMRAVRRVAFEGAAAVPGVGRALEDAFQRWWPLVVLVVTVTLGISCLNACLVGATGLVAAELGGVGDLGGGLLEWLGWSVVCFPAWPALYVVSVTDQTTRESLREAWDLVFDHPGYLVVGFLLVGASVLGIGTVLPAALIGATAASALAIPVFVAAIAMGLVGWSLGAVAYATLFATIEETDFDFREGRPPSRPRHPPQPASRTGATGTGVG